MNEEPTGPDPTDGSSDVVVEGVASRMAEGVRQLASRLRPFPPFLNMISVQAIELDPVAGHGEDRGCVVVLPDGEICELDLRVMPSFEEIDEVEQVEEFRELELSATEYIQYAANAIRALHQELRRRGQ